MDLCDKIITAPLIFIDGKFRENVHIKIDKDGRIDKILNSSSIKENVLELKNLAILPGFVNAHSHAFHRLLRGQSQIGNPGGDSFWKWREEMYKLVEEYCVDTFKEMLYAGITTVGEFHYIHHQESNERDYRLDMAVVEAAIETGIRLVLIETLYCRAGFGVVELQEEQHRFGSDAQNFIDNVQYLIDKTKPYSSQITIAVAAVDTKSLKVLWRWATKNNVAFHIHLEEQPKEIEDCLKVENKRPAELLLEELMDSKLDKLTAVHCSFTSREDLDNLAKAKANICVCPLTEGFLGDGIPNLNGEDFICLGTDCNNRISFIEEIRWLCYAQNLKNNSRNCAGLNAEKLLKIATQNGAKSLNLADSIGEFKESYFLDFVGFNLDSKRLEHFKSPEKLVDAIIFGCGNEEISMVTVNGKIQYSKDSLNSTV